MNKDLLLKHWPGDGLHSTPLWEWMLFVYLVAHIAWMALRRGGANTRGQDARG